MATIHPKVLALLACPVSACHATLKLEDDAWLVCTQCRRRYPVEDGWPVLIPDEAETPKD